MAKNCRLTLHTVEERRWDLHSVMLWFGWWLYRYESPNLPLSLADLYQVSLAMVHLPTFTETSFSMREMFTIVFKDTFIVV